MLLFNIDGLLRPASTDNNHLKATNELQIDALKSDVNRLQDETQTITKVSLIALRFSRTSRCF